MKKQCLPCYAIRKTTFALLCIFLFAAVSACAKSQENDNASNSISSDNPNITTIVWSMRTDDMGFNADLLNEKLLEDGYYLQLEMNYLGEAYDSDTMTYEEKQEQVRSDFMNCFSENKTDIVSMGLYGTENISELVRSGKLYDLTDYLESEEGAVLKGAFYETLWDTVKIDGTVCLIPSQLGSDGTALCVFNRNYFSEEDIRDFNGTPAELLSLLQESELENPIVVWTCSDEGAIAGTANQQYEGVLIDFTTGKVSSVYESDAFMEQLDAIRTMREMGYFGENGEYYHSSDDTVIDNLDFAVWVCGDVTYEYQKIEDSTITVQMPYAFRNRISCSVGINDGSAHKEEALQLLSLLYTNEIYANLLLWGEEETDYTINEEGYARSLSERSGNIYQKEILSGLFDWILPSLDEAEVSFILNRHEEKWSLYEKGGRVESIITSFCLDYTQMDDSVNEYYQIATEVMDQYMAGETDYDTMKTTLEEAGDAKIKELYQTQIDAFLAQN